MLGPGLGPEGRLPGGVSKNQPGGEGNSRQRDQKDKGLEVKGTRPAWIWMQVLLLTPRVGCGRYCKSREMGGGLRGQKGRTFGPKVGLRG